MHFEIVAVPKFYFKLSMEQLNILISLSQRHYDGFCKSLSAEDGLLMLWKKYLEVYKDSNGESPPLKAEWRDIDVCLKLLEWTIGLPANEKAQAELLFWDFNQALTHCRNTTSAWKTELETIQKQSPSTYK